MERDGGRCGEMKYMAKDGMNRGDCVMDVNEVDALPGDATSWSPPPHSLELISSWAGHPLPPSIHIVIDHLVHHHHHQQRRHHYPIVSHLFGNHHTPEFSTYTPFIEAPRVYPRVSTHPSRLRREERGVIDSLHSIIIHLLHQTLGSALVRTPIQFFKPVSNRFREIIRLPVQSLVYH
jgi:hypothetical protein